MSDLYDFPEDAERLPEGFKRIAYDSDTMKFLFRDCNGQLYQGEAGAEYGGIMTLISPSTTCLSRSRPDAFASDSDPSSTQTSRRNPKKKSTFQDILPPDLITTSSLSAESPTKTTPTREKIVKIVHNLRRSVTSIRDKRRIATSDPADELKHSKSSQAGSDIRRSATVATSRPHSKHPPS